MAQQDFVPLFKQAPGVFERRLVAGHLNGYVPPEKQRFPVHDIGDKLEWTSAAIRYSCFTFGSCMAKTAFDLKGYGEICSKLSTICSIMNLHA